MNIYEWMVNPNQYDPACSSCFYVGMDCTACKQLNRMNMDAVSMYTQQLWMYEKFIEPMKKKKKINKDDIVDEIHNLLEGMDNGEEKTD